MPARKDLRIGILIPPANTAMEDEIPPFLPPGVRISFNRLSREGRSLTAESLLSTARSVGRAAGVCRAVTKQATGSSALC